jgi:hypothetical protein
MYTTMSQKPTQPIGAFCQTHTVAANTQNSSQISESDCDSGLQTSESLSTSSNATINVIEEKKNWPQLIVFDLDFTLWPLWVCVIVVIYFI